MDVKNNPEDRGWVQGIAYAAQIMVTGHNEPGMAADIISESGLTLADFKAAKVDSYDMKPVRKLFREEWRLRDKPRSRRQNTKEQL